MYHFCSENRLSKILFSNPFPPKKTLVLWISKIRIWILSEESTKSVDFMGWWSVFGFAPPPPPTQKKKPQNPFLDSEIRIWIFPKTPHSQSPALSVSMRPRYYPPDDDLIDFLFSLTPSTLNSQWIGKITTQQGKTSKVIKVSDVFCNSWWMTVTYLTSGQRPGVLKSNQIEYNSLVYTNSVILVI